MGVLEADRSLLIGEAAPTLKHLRDLGLTDPRPGLRYAMAASLIHSSYLHENLGELGGLTAGVLDALNRAGDGFLRRTAAAAVYHEAAATTSGELSKAVAKIAATFPAWAARQGWLRESAILSVGLNRSQLPPKVLAALMRQITGVLCLEGEQSVVKSLLSPHIDEQLRAMASDISDPKTHLYDLMGRDALTFVYERLGPEHAPVFDAVVTDARGRTGKGSGPGKKAASQRAAHDFLRRHMPQEFTSTRITTASPEQPRELHPSFAHSRAVRQLQDLFSLRDAARALLSQAFVHPSWAYENRGEIKRRNQQDYQVLAHMGSHVLPYEHQLALARHAVMGPSDTVDFQSLPNSAYDAAFQLVGLADGVLLGAGQASLGTTPEIRADVFQAVIGAVAAADHFEAPLARRWPAAWSSVWGKIVPTRGLRKDPTTRLQQASSAMKLELDFEFGSIGPRHDEEFQATACLHSTMLGGHFRVPGPWIKGGKTPARHEASTIVLEILDRLSTTAPARSLDGAHALHQELAAFLLTQQAHVLQTAPISTQRWSDLRLFGLHLAADPNDLLTWAHGADELLGPDLDLPADSSLRTVLRKSLEEPADPDRLLDTHLADTLRILEQVEAPDKLTQEHISRLIHLCDIFRCLGADDSDISLPDLVSDWSILHRRHLTTPAAPPPVQLSGRERAILDAAVTAVAAGRGNVGIDILNDRPLHLRIHSDSITPVNLTDISTLWPKVSRTATMKPHEHGLDVIVTTTPLPSNPGPISQAVIGALRPSPEPYRAAMADLLHDLKNQLVAARLAESQPAESRTARLQQQLTASRHLDEAHALAMRLRAATAPPAGNSARALELGSFLRHYAGTVLTRLPPFISLATPKASRAVQVAIDPRTLTAALDNLVGNAIEALHQGGHISLAWVADAHEAVIEISDDGPGLPSDIAAALAAGQRIRSTKPGGNGLGLLSARSLLTRAGGQLAHGRTSTGTAWFITLPRDPATFPEPA
ncbi:ATP-binding protein [Streptomyces parvulus]|uniref:ATP-binding protein n=1 Tax=Streptomyces parvulus TaxID=146923 RepID=UPI0033212A1F